MKKIILVVIGMVFASLLYAQQCPKCNSTMYWTGETKSDWGKLLKIYACPAGHRYLLNSEQSTPSYGDSSRSFNNDNNSWGNSYATLKCPICGSSVYWTGEIDNDYGKMLKIYKCPAGHKSIGK